MELNCASDLTPRPNAAARFSIGIGHLVVGFKAKAIFAVLTPFLITVNDYLPKRF